MTLLERGTAPTPSASPDASCTTRSTFFHHSGQRAESWMTAHTVCNGASRRHTVENW